MLNFSSPDESHARIDLLIAEGDYPQALSELSMVVKQNSVQGRLRATIITGEIKLRMSAFEEAFATLLQVHAENAALRGSQETLTALPFGEAIHIACQLYALVVGSSKDLRQTLCTYSGEKHWASPSTFISEVYDAYRGTTKTEDLLQSLVPIAIALKGETHEIPLLRAGLAIGSGYSFFDASSPDIVVATHTLKGHLAIATSDWSSAYDHFRKAEELFHWMSEEGSKQLVIAVQIACARVALVRGFHRSVAHLEPALSIFAQQPSEYPLEACSIAEILREGGKYNSKARELYLSFARSADIRLADVALAMMEWCSVSISAFSEGEDTIDEFMDQLSSQQISILAHRAATLSSGDSEIKGGERASFQLSVVRFFSEVRDDPATIRALSDAVSCCIQSEVADNEIEECIIPVISRLRNGEHSPQLHKVLRRLIPLVREPEHTSLPLVGTKLSLAHEIIHSRRAFRPLTDQIRDFLEITPYLISEINEHADTPLGELQRIRLVAIVHDGEGLLKECKEGALRRSIAERIEALTQLEVGWCEATATYAQDEVDLSSELVLMRCRLTAVHELNRSTQVVRVRHVIEILERRTG